MGTHTSVRTRVKDAFAFPFVYPAAWLLGKVRSTGVESLPRSKRALMRMRVFPITDHYYEPRFDLRAMRDTLSRERDLPGIDWNVEGQLAFLASLTFADELARLPLDEPGERRFYLNNGSFEAGDAEVWYQIIRRLRPRRIIEIGSGNSTLMAIEAIARTRADDETYACDHVCVEPYEMPWLDDAPVTVVREKVEDLGPGFFAGLESGDILFIDSSHVIRPGGDILYEYLGLLPTLRPGVIVHIHDVFSPRDYRPEWLVDEVRLWNEQYLLEAFLTHNREWEIAASLNHLRHHHFEALRRVAPFMTEDSEPGSFYIRRRD